MLPACSLEQASGDDRVIDSSYVIMSIVVCNTNFKKKKKIVDRSVASENGLKPFYESISYSVTVGRVQYKYIHQLHKACIKVLTCHVVRFLNRFLKKKPIRGIGLCLRGSLTRLPRDQ